MSLSAKIPSALLVAVLILTAGVYSRLHDADFINLDDDVYIHENPHIQDGLSWQAVRWAFSAELLEPSDNADYWRPLTFLSHMVDIELFGLNPVGHHWINVAFHLANVVLLYGLLRWTSGQPYPSLFVAAVFALHPLQVESVAWVAERKDVLSTCLGLLSLGTYCAYVKQSTWTRYAVGVGVFALGLMAKPMLVTLPFVMLLLDLWPLGRIEVVRGGSKVEGRGSGDESGQQRISPGGTAWSFLLMEKLPWFILAVCSALITMSADAAKSSLEQIPLANRLANALVVYVTYLGKMAWPHDLAVFYPHSGAPPTWQVTGAIVVLGAITGWVTWSLARRPYRGVGWFWYLGTLVPVIGIIQVGAQSSADRFTYFPIVGVTVIIAWSGRELNLRWPAVRRAILILAPLLVIGMAALTWQQLGYWQNSVSLFRHTLAVTLDNPIIENNLGAVMSRHGQYLDAEKHLREAIRLNPKYDSAHNNLSIVLVEQGQYQDAERHLREAIRLNPKFAKAHSNLGAVLLTRGAYAEAARHLREAIQQKPSSAKSLNNLAWMYATNPRAELRNAAEAVRLAQRACRLTARLEPGCLDTLAAAYAEAGQFDDAVTTAEEAIGLANADGQQKIAAQIRKRLELYRQGRPYRERVKND